MSEPGTDLDFYDDPFQVTTGPLEVVPGRAELRGPLPTTDAIPSPDWIVIGVPGGDDGSVLLFASLTLSYAELKREVEGFDLVPVLPSSNAPMARVPRERITIRAEMSNFTLIYGIDYPSAMRSLMEAWARARPQS